MKKICIQCQTNLQKMQTSHKEFSSRITQLCPPFIKSILKVQGNRPLLCRFNAKLIFIQNIPHSHATEISCVVSL